MLTSAAGGRNREWPEAYATLKALDEAVEDEAISLRGAT
jgi:hypothetical protein